MYEIIKMSDKGQLVVPQSIREMQKLNPGERFIALPIGDGVFFKKIELVEFENLAKEIAAQFKSNKITKQDVKEAVKWAKR